MEGDVDGVMERPSAGGGMKGDDLQRERDKWDAWNSQKGLGRTEAKRRYIEVLIDIMHKYATSEYAAPLLLLVDSSRFGLSQYLIVIKISGLTNLWNQQRCSRTRC